jgi:hypothetical protein
MVSTPMLNMLREANVGSFLKSPITLKTVHFSGFSFVDDTDTIQTARSCNETWREVVQGLQQSLTLWQGGLRASGGAIIPEKSTWSLVDFKWRNGIWKYCTMENTPATLQVKDIGGALHTLTRLEHNEAVTSLGVELAPDGNMLKQFEPLRNKSIKWADQMKTAKLNHSDTWTALTANLSRSLIYPLQATALSESMCYDIMKPALNQGLTQLGLCRNFPRALIFAPKSCLGLGLPHLHTIKQNKPYKITR